MSAQAEAKGTSLEVVDKWNTVAVVILKDEAEYIEDWLIFHLSIGVEHFFIYDNNSQDCIRSLLTKYIAGGVVTLITWPIRAGQIDAYNHALFLLKGCCEWICYIDVDEYIVLHEHDDLVSFLADCAADQVLLPWRNFPYGGHKSRPGGSDIENYFWAYPVKPDQPVQVKHIVKASASVRATAHFSLIGAKKTIIADGTEYPPSHFIVAPTYKRAQINHYSTRSYSENLRRIQKGQVDGGVEKQVAHFAALTPEGSAHLEYDANILRHFGRFAVERKKWTSVAPIPHRFGLMQRKRVLSSWNNVPFFFSKSYANYLAGRGEIAHGTDLNLIHVDIQDKEHELRRYWHDTDLFSLSFRVDQQSYMPYFMGSIHYGDFVRRFNFEARITIRELEVAASWSQSISTTAEAYVAIFDIASEGGVAIQATVNDKILSAVPLQRGHHAGMIYDPVYRFEEAPITLSISGACRIRELILGCFV